MPDEKKAEINVQIDQSGNLVLKGLDPDALEGLRKRLENARAEALIPSPKVRIEAIIA